MELEILDKRENPLLGRVEVDFIIHHTNQSTPKRNAVRDMLSKELKVQKDNVIVDHLKSEFGKGDTKGYAKVYAKKEIAVQIERKHILKRNRLLDEPKKQDDKPKEKASAEEKKSTEKKPAPAKEDKPDEKKKSSGDDKPAKEKSEAKKDASDAKKNASEKASDAKKGASGEASEDKTKDKEA